MTSWERIDGLCDRFEDALASSKPLKIEDVVGEASDLNIGQLLGLLLEVELEFRHAHSDVPKPEEYETRFPGFADIIAEAFLTTRKRLGNGNALRETALSPPGLGDYLPRHQVTLIIKEPGHSLRKVSFRRRESLIAGRSAEAGLRLNADQATSRFHCRFDISPPQCSVTDLESRNGTRLNGQTASAALLSNGDVIQVGKVSITIRIEELEPPCGEQTALKAAKTRQPKVSSHSVAEHHVPGYELLGQIGKGGMGIVYEARHLPTGRTFAIKVLNHAANTSETARIRFLREASFAVKLQHRRIVRCHDFGETGSSMYLVLDRVLSVDTMDILKTFSHRRRIKAATGLICLALSGMAYAHSQNIIHRDMKPANLLVSRTGKKLSLQITDFGLAKNYQNAGFGDLTKTNEVFGTVAYLPPEQILDCRFVSPAGDIYSTGVCLYKFLTGRLPFEKKTDVQTLSAILHEPAVRVEEHGADIPKRLADIVHRAIHREPSQRFSSAREMQRQLRAFLNDSP
jgi:hypothetical protein